MKIDKPLQITEELRERLGKPIGKLIAGSEENLGHAVEVIKNELQKEKSTLMVTVGDVVAKSFNDAGLAMDIAIVDYHVKRVETFKNLSEIGFSKSEPDVVVENPKGVLTSAAFEALEEAVATVNNTTIQSPPQRDPAIAGQYNNKPFVIRVIGEEDLLTLAVILVAPLGTHVFYGQPNEGIVDVPVTPEKKSETRDIVSQFNS